MCSRASAHSFPARRQATRGLTLLGTLVILLSAPWGGLGQAPVLSKPMENVASPQVMGPLNQPAGAHGGASGPAYGEVRWSLQPVGGAIHAIDGIDRRQAGQSQLPEPVERGRSAGSASRWVAGGASVGRSPRAFAGSSPSAFSAQPLSPVAIGTSGRAMAAPKAQLPTNATPGSAPDDAISFAGGIASFAARPVAMPLVKAPTSEGMVIRLIPTADGVQLVLQTRTSLAGSVLADQSGISRHGGNVSEGWWAWGAGAGSWAPISVLTSSPLAKPTHPGEGRTHKADPASRADKTPGIAAPEE